MFGWLRACLKAMGSRACGIVSALLATTADCCQQRARIQFSDSVEAASSGLQTFCTVCLVRSVKLPVFNQTSGW